MKAVQYFQYGSLDNLTLQEIPIPEPGPDEVLVRVRVASINPLDWRMVRADPFLVRLMFGIFAPKHPGLGADFSGVIEKLGSGANQFSVGEAVLGTVFPNKLGSLAEYVVVKECSILSKPDSLPFDQAATLGVAALTARHGITQYQKLDSGSRVLINGASGGVGTFATQLAKSTGAHVTGISSSKNHGLVRSLGADATICYQDTCIEKINTPPFDLIFDTIGSYPPAKLRKHLKPDGQLVYASAPNGLGFIRYLLDTQFHKNSHIIVEMQQGQDELSQLCDAIHRSSLKPVIDRSIPIKQFKDAFAYLETKRARGKVVVSMHG